MANLLAQTKVALHSIGKTKDDIQFIGSSNPETEYEITWKAFESIANIEFNSSSLFSIDEPKMKPIIVTDLVIAGEGWWLSRHIYIDENKSYQEDWQPHVAPIRPKMPRAIKHLKSQDDNEKGVTLDCINRPEFTINNNGFTITIKDLGKQDIFVNKQHLNHFQITKNNVVKNPHSDCLVFTKWNSRVTNNCTTSEVTGHSTELKYDCMDVATNCDLGYCDNYILARSIVEVQEFFNQVQLGCGKKTFYVPVNQDQNYLLLQATEETNIYKIIHSDLQGLDNKKLTFTDGQTIESFSELFGGEATVNLDTMTVSGFYEDWTELGKWIFIKAIDD